MHQHNKAFSLVELSVVLIIISVLTVSIYVSQDLIEQARIKKIISEYDVYVKEIEVFKDIYFRYPGDMPNASDFWGSDCSTLDANCNGDGDGVIEFSTTNVLNNEAWRAWQHLKLAGIDSNKLSGIGDAGDTASTRDYNAPSSAYRNAGWEFRDNGSSDNIHTTLNFFDIPLDGNTATGTIITPKQLFLIDEKIDDGFPRRGMVMANSSSSSCFNNAVTPNIYSNLNSSSVLCGVQFIVIKGSKHPNYE